MTVITVGSKYEVYVRSPALSHMQTLEQPIRTLAIKWEVNMLLKKSSCLFLRTSVCIIESLWYGKWVYICVYLHESADDNTTLRFPKSTYITGDSFSDCLIPYSGNTLGESCLSAQMLSVYTAAPADWATTFWPRLDYLFVSQNPSGICASHSPGEILGCPYTICSYGQI